MALHVVNIHSIKHSTAECIESHWLERCDGRCEGRNLNDRTAGCRLMGLCDTC